MKHPNYDYLNFLDYTTISVTGLQPALDFIDDRLEEDIKDLIREKNIYIINSIGPGCIFDNVCLNDNEKIGHLIIIDKTLTWDLLKFNPTEIAAEILHEIGHVINKPDNSQGENIEFYADDFAIACQFSAQLKSGLEKYKNVISHFSGKTSDSPFFKDLKKQKQIMDLLDLRIKRIA